MNYRFLLTGITVLMLAACSSDRDRTAEAVEAEMAEIDSIEIDARMDQELEKRMKADPKLAKLREAAFKLSEFIRLDGDHYVLDISKEDAANIGVDSETYNYHLNEIAKTNETIAEMRANGDSIELPDIQKSWKEYNDKKQ